MFISGPRRRRTLFSGRLLVHYARKEGSSPMRRLVPLAACLLLAACGGSDDPPSPEANAAGGTAASAPAPAQAPPPAAPVAEPKATGERWELRSTPEGSTLALLSSSGHAAIRLFCPAGSGQLLVNVPGFRPIGSEERLSFGSGGAVTALVADTSGDQARGGVSGTAPVPAELPALLAGPVSASYGAQNLAPRPAPAAETARSFVAACRQGVASSAPTKGGQPNPCETQGNGRLAVRPLRAIGTEPFWAARVVGRCITYSHPENQEGTRIWTRYTAGPGGTGTWVGAHAGKRFELRIRAAPGCSDGMSDRRYPSAAELLVDGERRQGCAAPL
jgi:uncharacterized membrane protein